MYNKVCPIDKNYVQADMSCTGSYRQGGFQFYPPFAVKGCQCKELLDRRTEEEKEGDYAAPLMYITDDKQSEKLENPASPCIIKFENEQRKDGTTPNLWTKMNTNQLSINVKKVPENGEILMLSNYRPDFWKNQPKLVTVVVTAKDVEEAKGNKEVLFKSTNEIWIVTRCKPDVGSACGSFEFDYSKVVIEKDEKEFPNWSIIITIYIGFTLMLLSFLYFEWRCALKCIKNCIARCFKGRRSQNNTVNSEDDSNEAKVFMGDYRQSGAESQHYHRSKQDDDMLDDGIAHGLDRLYSKSKKNEISYGDHGFDGHDYASNRQD